MSQLVRLEGKHSTQNAHCAVVNIYLGDLCIFYLLFVLIIGIHPTERRVQQCMHQVNPALVGSSYPGSVLVSKTSTHYISGEVAFPSLMIGWVWIPLLWSGDASVLGKGSQKNGTFS